MIVAFQKKITRINGRDLKLFFIFLAIFGIVFGGIWTFNNIAAQNRPLQLTNAPPVVDEKKDQVLYIIEEELNQLYTQRKILELIYNKSQLDDDWEYMSEKELKAMLKLEKSLATINKKILALESKKRFI